MEYSSSTKNVTESTFIQQVTQLFDQLFPEYKARSFSKTKRITEPTHQAFNVEKSNWVTDGLVETRKKQKHKYLNEKLNKYAQPNELDKTLDSFDENLEYLLTYLKFFQDKTKEIIQTYNFDGTMQDRIEFLLNVVAVQITQLETQIHNYGNHLDHNKQFALYYYQDIVERFKALKSLKSKIYHFLDQYLGICFGNFHKTNSHILTDNLPDKIKELEDTISPISPNIEEPKLTQKSSILNENEKYNSLQPIYSLPDELLIKILGYLPQEELVNISSLTQRLRAISQDEKFLKKVVNSLEFEELHKLFFFYCSQGSQLADILFRNDERIDIEYQLKQTLEVALLRENALLLACKSKNSKLISQLVEEIITRRTIIHKTKLLLLGDFFNESVLSVSLIEALNGNFVYLQTVCKLIDPHAQLAVIDNKIVLNTGLVNKLVEFLLSNNLELYGIEFSETNITCLKYLSNLIDIDNEKTSLQSLARPDINVLTAILVEQSNYKYTNLIKLVIYLGADVNSKINYTWQYNMTSNGSYEEVTPLHFAAKYGSPQLIKFLVESGSNSINATCVYSEVSTLIIIAWNKKVTPLLMSVRNLDNLKLLINLGAVIHHPDEDVASLLSHVAQEVEVAENVIDFCVKDLKLNPNTQDSISGDTLLHRADMSMSAIAQLLSLNCIDPLIRNRSGKFALTSLCENYPSSEVVIKYTLKSLFTSNKEGYTALHAVIMLKNIDIDKLLEFLDLEMIPAYTDWKNPIDWKPPQYLASIISDAIKKNNIKKLRLCLLMAPTIDFYEFEKNNNANKLTTGQDLEIRPLSSKSFDPNLYDLTPLFQAIVLENSEITKLLLLFGANIEAPVLSRTPMRFNPFTPSFYYTPLAFSLFRKDTKLFNYLLDYKKRLFDFNNAVDLALLITAFHLGKKEIVKKLAEFITLLEIPKPKRVTKHIQKGANGNYQDKLVSIWNSTDKFEEPLTLLQWIYEAIIEKDDKLLALCLLFSNNINIIYKHKGGIGNFLALAVYTYNPTAVRLLLDNGADPCLPFPSIKHEEEHVLFLPLLTLYKHKAPELVLSGITIIKQLIAAVFMQNCELSDTKQVKNIIITLQILFENFEQGDELLRELITSAVESLNINITELTLDNCLRCIDERLSDNIIKSDGNVNVIKLYLYFKHLIFKYDKIIEQTITSIFIVDNILTQFLRRTDTVTPFIEKYLLDEQQLPSEDFLKCVALFGNKKIIKLLAQKKENLLNIFPRNVTLLHAAACTGNTKVAKSLLNILKSSSPLPFHNPISNYINIQMNNGFTPLFISTYIGHEEMTEFLLANKANPDLSDNNKAVPIHHAIHHNYAKIAMMLLSANANFKTAFPKNYSNYSIGDLADWPLHAAKNNHLRLLQLCIYLKISVICKDPSKQTPLHHACIVGGIEVVELLLKTNATLLSSIDSHNKYAIHYAAEFGHAKLLVTLLKNSNLKNLINELQDENGNTPLHLAAINCQIEAYELLEKKFGAKANLLNNEEHTSQQLLVKAIEEKLSIKLIQLANIQTVHVGESKEEALKKLQMEINYLQSKLEEHLQYETSRENSLLP